MHESTFTQRPMRAALTALIALGAGWRQQPEPAGRVEAGQPSLGHRRQFRCRARPVQRCRGERDEPLAAELNALGLGEPVMVSATQGRNTGDLADLMRFNVAQMNAQTLRVLAPLLR